MANKKSYLLLEIDLLMNKRIKEIYLEIYSSKYKKIWNELIKESSNALFFHNRNYLEYNKKLYN